jgi:hypothetical protein
MQQQQQENFFEACERGDSGAVNRLLQDFSDLDPADEDNYAIRTASQQDHLSVVNRLLQDERVNPADDGNAAIGNASAQGRLSVVNRLLEDKRVNPAASGNCPIDATMM